MSLVRICATCVSISFCLQLRFVRQWCHSVQIRYTVPVRRAALTCITHTSRRTHSAGRLLHENVVLPWRPEKNRFHHNNSYLFRRTDWLCVYMFVYQKCERENGLISDMLLCALEAILYKQGEGDLVITEKRAWNSLWSYVSLNSHDQSPPDQCPISWLRKCDLLLIIVGCFVTQGSNMPSFNVRIGGTRDWGAGHGGLSVFIAFKRFYESRWVIKSSGLQWWMRSVLTGRLPGWRCDDGLLSRSKWLRPTPFCMMFSASDLYWRGRAQARKAKDIMLGRPLRNANLLYWYHKIDWSHAELPRHLMSVKVMSERRMNKLLYLTSDVI